MLRLLIYADGDCDDVCDIVIVPQVGRTGRVNYDYASTTEGSFSNQSLSDWPSRVVFTHKNIIFSSSNFCLLNKKFQLLLSAHNIFYCSFKSVSKKMFSSLLKFFNLLSRD